MFDLLKHDPNEIEKDGNIIENAHGWNKQTQIECDELFIYCKNKFILVSAAWPL